MNQSVRTLEEVFSAALPATAPYTCPVCQHVYKTRSGLDKHFGARSCSTLRDRIEMTEAESLIYKMYREAVSSKKKHYGIRSFRSNAVLYHASYELWSFCGANGFSQVQAMQYASYCVTLHPSLAVFKAFYIGVSNRTLDGYRMFLAKNPDLIDSSSFFFDHKQELISNMSFLIRSVQEARVSLQYIRDHVSMPELYNRSTQIEQMRYMRLLRALV